MRREDLNQIDDNYISQMLEEVFGYTDEHLAAELDRAAAEASQNPDLHLAPPEDEFEKIMARVHEEEELEKKGRKVVRIRKVLRPMLVAAVLGTIVLGAGIGVSGKQSYVFSRWYKGKNSIGYENAEDLMNEDEEEKAYEMIQKEIGISAADLYYVPSKMYFEYIDIENGRADMVFDYNGNYIHFHQALKSVTVSTNIVSDREVYKTINHRVFGAVAVYKNPLDEENTEFSAHFSVDNAYYYLTGVMEEDEFIKILQRMGYYSG